MPATDPHETDGHHPVRINRRRGALAAAAAGLLALGGATGAVVVAATRPPVQMAPATPTPIRALSSNGIVTIRGRVAEIYGNKIIVADASGRALVDLGPEGDDRALVTAAEPVVVQGRFERGFVHAAFLVGPDNTVLALGPLAGPPHGPRGGHGFARGPDGPPPPPEADRSADAPPAAAPPAAAAAMAPTPLASQ